MSVHRTKWYLFFPLLLWLPTALAQQVVELNLSSTQSGFVIQKLTNTVRRQNSGPLLFCDRAVQHQSANQLRAYGHVLLVQGDSITIKSDSLLYDSNSRQATLYGHVMFQDRRTILTTERLVYNFPLGMAQYANRARIVDNRTVVTSQQGLYDTQLKQFTFRNNVRLVNGPKSMVADSLRYTTTSQLAVRLIPTSPVGKTGVLVAQQSAGHPDAKAITTLRQTVLDTPLPKPVVTTVVLASLEKTPPPIDSIRTLPVLYRIPIQNAVATRIQVNGKSQESSGVRPVTSKPVARASLIRTASTVAPPPSTDILQESDLERELNKKRRFN